MSTINLQTLSLYELRSMKARLDERFPTGTMLQWYAQHKGGGLSHGSIVGISRYIGRIAREICRREEQLAEAVKQWEKRRKG